MPPLLYGDQVKVTFIDRHVDQHAGIVTITVFLNQGEFPGERGLTGVPGLNHGCPAGGLRKHVVANNRAVLSIHWL